jgi:hypothetical protein
MSLFTTWARAHRFARAVSAALFLFLMTAVLWWMRLHPPDIGPSRGTITAVVGDDPLGEPARKLVTLRLQDGRDARILVPAALAREGTDLPVVVETHDGGEGYVTFDLERWADEEGGGTTPGR